MDDVYLGLGSNLGEREENLQRAVAEIAELAGTRLVAESGVYQSAPVGPQDQADYLNMAVHIQTLLDPTVLLAMLQAIEARLGRPPAAQRIHWGPRVIDIDLLLYADRVIAHRSLRVPHPAMDERWFVLKPLADLAPQLNHPAIGRTIRDLLADVEQPVAGAGGVRA